MPSPFHGIELASRALRAFQRGLDVTGHNIANVNTRGYTRQAADYSATEPTTFQGIRQLSLGTGVAITSINRIRDVFLDNRMIEAGGSLGRFQTLSATLQQVEPLFNEPGDAGISSALTKFFNAWSGLASNPNEPAARLEVQQTGATLAQRIRNAYGQMVSIKQQVNANISTTLNKIDDLTSQISDLNKQIRAQTVNGDVPGDLLDRRDLALDDLSKIADIGIQRKDDGSVNIFLNGFTLVDDTSSYAVPKNFDLTTFALTGTSGASRVDSGQLYGLMEASNKISAYMSQLDTLANSLRTEINTAHAAGINGNGTTGINFFNDVATPPQTGAVDFNLSAEVLSDSRNIAAGTSGKAGDGGLALAIAQMRETSSSLLGGKKFSEFYSQLIAGIGQDVEGANIAIGTQQAIVDQIDLQRQSISGVSIDEEMANMLRLQRSYQAAAKALSIFDQVTEELIGMIR